MIKTLFSFILIIVVFAAGFWVSSKVTDTPDPIVKTKTKVIPGDTITDTVQVDKPVPKYVYRDTGSMDTLVEYRYKDVDTTQILTDYFSKVIYHDTLKDDSSAFISLSDTISRNRIQNRKLFFRNNRETKIITNNYYKQDGVYIGGKIGLGVTGIDLMYLNNQDMYGIGVDALMLDKPEYFFNIQYKRLIWKRH